MCNDQAGPRGDGLTGMPEKEYAKLQLSGKTFTNADLSGATFKNAVLRGAKFVNCRLDGASFRGADLTDAKFVEGSEETFTDADLSGAVFRNAVLRGAKFVRCGLEGTTFRNADLTNAVFDKPEGLSVQAFGGAELTGATLPAEVAEFVGMKNVEEISKYLQSLFKIILAICSFALMTVLSMRDENIILHNAVPSTVLPFIQASIALSMFGWIIPLIIFTLFWYMLDYLKELWVQLSRLPAMFPDGSELDRRAYPLTLNCLVRKHLLKLQDEPAQNQQVVIAYTLIFLDVIFTYAVFWLLFLKKHDWYLTGFHAVLLAMTCSLAVRFIRQAPLWLGGEDIPSLRDSLRGSLAQWDTLLRHPFGVSLVLSIVFGFAMLVRDWFVGVAPASTTASDKSAFTWDLYAALACWSVTALIAFFHWVGFPIHLSHALKKTTPGGDNPGGKSQTDLTFEKGVAIAKRWDSWISVFFILALAGYYVTLALIFNRGESTLIEYEKNPHAAIGYYFLRAFNLGLVLAIVVFFEQRLLRARAVKKICPVMGPSHEEMVAKFTTVQPFAILWDPIGVAVVLASVIGLFSHWAISGRLETTTDWLQARAGIPVKFHIDVSDRQVSSRPQDWAGRQSGDSGSTSDALDFVKGADLEGTDLCYTMGFRVFLARANLKNAQLRGAFLVDADLREVYCEKTDFQGAILRSADLTNAQLREANLTDVVFREATVDTEKVFDTGYRPNQNGTILAFANLEKALFDTKIISTCRSYKMAYYTCDKWLELGLYPMRYPANFKDQYPWTCPADLTADLKKEEKEKCKQVVWDHNTHLRYHQLIGYDLSRQDFLEADLDNFDFRGAKFAYSRLRKAKLRNADLREADFTEANLQLADFSAAKLDGADFKGADLRSANLKGLDLSKAKNLTREQVRQAILDKDPVLPKPLADEFAKEAIRAGKDMPGK